MGCRRAQLNHWGRLSTARSTALPTSRKGNLKKKSNLFFFNYILVSGVFQASVQLFYLESVINLLRITVTPKCYASDFFFNFLIF